jgi:hypothetical protein
MLKVKAALLPLNAVADSSERATAPPICQRPTVVTGDTIRLALDHDVDHVVAELGYVAGAEIVVPAERVGGVEHRLG